MVREIIWSPFAERKLFSILEYFTERNKSKAYSLKLYNRFQKQLSALNKNPEIGIKTNFINIRALIINDYTLYYEVTNENIIVHILRDNRQNPEDLVIR
ncbi:type II toxin-antitoxin system RelE/ParE family toxin [Flavobacterium sp. Sd200]|uniref:type II toxin-antitoxin system RelE/ParE family toxin n=1 Tax=Flavobacterium sp. Sd200 TaxID=2692211 RepID=UPI001371142A|nr:type II toxin-antitoxin system RelE/ParE family toxin [Flavobacterium sp. Sd200]